jgi:hypothetical protein
MLLGIASSRSLFCQFLKTLEKIEYISFFSKKVLIYAVVYMAVIMLLAICNRVVYDSPFSFAFMVILTSFFWFCHESGFWTISAIIAHSAINSFEKSWGVIIQMQPINYGGLLTG